LKGYMNNLFLKKMAKLFVALYDGAVVAGDLEFFYGKVMTDHTKASDMRYDKYSTNDVMVWNLILYGNRNGFLTLDLDDTWPDPKSPFHGIHKFKEKWNGQIVETNDYYLGKSREADNYLGKAYVVGKYIEENKRIIENKFSTLVGIRRDLM
ncbi:MAG TPA: GNAT family N-acetyltransferase, partial [Methanotrichaceae archaeon]|nr:GNAT family N-acetyltransferase [Methanotrichaceae archaeon]